MEKEDSKPKSPAFKTQVEESKDDYDSDEISHEELEKINGGRTESSVFFKEVRKSK